MIRDACAAIEESLGSIIAEASLYETEPMGAADSLFLNTAVLLSSSLTPLEVMPALLSIEQKLGRIRTERWGNRTIDLDMLLCAEHKPSDQWSQLILNHDTLKIPHPEMLVRSFVMLPAAEIAGDWQHPVEKVRLNEALTRNFGHESLSTAKTIPKD
jgi:2-amino-4-hydroxy-6-hydroxymethyldihydropteridine diphosphokinase